MLSFQISVSENSLVHGISLKKKCSKTANFRNVRPRRNNSTKTMGMIFMKLDMAGLNESFSIHINFDLV
jgi:hypothetical protein